jgi:glycosyltransferase involved in cell wall biosynthesis
MSDLSRVAIVDHVSAGGVSRFLLALITHMADLRPDVQFDYYVSQTNIDRDGLRKKLQRDRNVKVISLDPPHVVHQAPPAKPQKVRGAWWQIPVGLLKKMPWLHKRLLAIWIGVHNVLFPPPPLWWRYRLPDDVVRQLKEYDVIYLGWPYYMEPVKFGAPLVATFHDFHYRQFPEAYGDEQRNLVERQTRTWLKRCTTAVTSTGFIKDELLSYYHRVAPKVDVVYLAPYGFERPSAESIEATLARLGVQHPYALFSGGRSGHKNFVAILEAAGILKQRGTPVHLAITGLGADVIGKPSDEHPSDPIHRMNEIIKEYRMISGVDYFPLGYVPNEDVDALTAGADVVVSASLYEAGCGPANDAWQAGVPVAFSNIPPFLEQIRHFGVAAWVFDPHDPSDVADKMHSAVFDRETTRAMVAQSLHVFDAYTWDDVARGYLRVFAEAAAAGVRGR